jgi:hypothetical protein
MALPGIATAKPGNGNGNGNGNGKGRGNSPDFVRPARAVCRRD